MRKVSIIAGIMVLVFCVGVLVGTSEAVSAQDHGCGHNGKGFWTNLTDEQRQAVQEKIEEMKSQDATREEIHSAVAEMLKGYGIEVPEDWHGPIGFGPGKARFQANLTEEQREAVRDKIKEMRSRNASREEIHTAVTEMLKSYGIEMPENWEGPHGRGDFGPGPVGFFKDLTKEQREAVRAKTKEMRDQNASPEEIHAAVAEMLKGYGIDVPENWEGPHDRGDFGPGPVGFFKDLTKEQREAVRAKTKEMRDQNASPEEIHAAVAEMLKGYGIEVPEDWHGPIGFGHGRGGLGANLTDEQRQAIQEKIKGMRDQGAKREEIHAAVAEMLKGYGIEVPEDWTGPHDRGGFGPGPGGLWKNLTKEQREAVREKIKEMRSQGATREEIRAAVDEMIQGYGIQSPQESESVSSDAASAVSNVIAQSYPNPFNPETEISYTLPENSYVSVTIFNVQGQKVKRLVNEYQPAGTRKVVWDGRDENGEGVASGIYFYRIEAGSHSVTNRMILLK
jgi:DNA-binding transcriptional regulator YhcF (GntR family)